jgi:signal transduction histidine kinase
LSTAVAGRYTKLTLPSEARAGLGLPLQTVRRIVPALTNKLTISSMDSRMITMLRLVLASAALLATIIDPFEPARHTSLTYATLVLYIVYTVRQSPFVPATSAHWVDVGWYVVLIGLSGGASSIFFFFFLFAILTASFQWGFASGLCVTLVSNVLFISVGYMTAPTGPEFDLNVFLLRPIYLVVFGYMMAYWGGEEITMKRRLALLKDVSTPPNPRFGIDHTLGSIMERLRAFYDADSCLLIRVDQSTGERSLRRADHRTPGTAGRAEPFPEGLERLLLALPPTQAVVSHSEPRFWTWWRPRAVSKAYDVVTGEFVAHPPPVSGVLAAESCLTVPFRHRDETVGRLYLTTQRRCAFDVSDVAFLLHVLDHTIPVIDNVRLVDQLASDAAEVERRRIARDLHDSVIQPYIGLQMGLAAVRQKLLSGNAAVRDDIERLMALTDAGIADLRHYMGGLQSSGGRAGSLLLAVRRFADKFAEATGITVHFEAQTDMPVSNRLAAEVFQMVAEGLSNVRRHTSSTQATVGLTCQHGSLTLRIANDTAKEASPVSFTPHSITERATALGGRVHIEATQDRGTAVVVEIPL